MKSEVVLVREPIYDIIRTSSLHTASMAFEAQAQVQKLLSELFDEHHELYGLGSMTCSVYDIAWVANVSKTVSGIPQYLFPSAFAFVLDAQLPDGSWSTHHVAAGNAQAARSSQYQSDTILSTIAALYSLILHARAPYQISSVRFTGLGLDLRIATGIKRLGQLLEEWHIESCDAVGFEILFPSLLDLLLIEGYSFDFPDREKLLSMRKAKLQHLKPEYLYTKAPSTLLHSLEAFHSWGSEEFDVRRVKHHMIGGSMMASPAATASYLIKTPEWDEEAEAYLRMVIERGHGKGSGGVPSAWLSTNFEMLRADMLLFLLPFFSSFSYRLLNYARR